MADERHGDGQRLAEVRLPWQRDHEIESNIAIGSLRDSILAWLTTARGVHVETLMTVVGALAGFAAQCAAWDAVRRSGRPAPKDGLALATTPSGERFYFGDLINGHLIPEGAREWTVWGFAAAAAVEAGLPEGQLPDYVDMFRHASATIGTGDFGVPRVSEDHRPHLLPREALARFWPATKAILARADGPEPGKSVPVAYWPAILGLVARHYILMAREALDPAMSLSLMMESAITMSKVDPDGIPTTAPATPELAR